MNSSSVRAQQLDGTPRANDSRVVELLERISQQLADAATTGPVLLLDSPAAAKALAISERTLWSLTNSGVISPTKIGRAVRYAVADLQDYIERSREK